MRRLDAHGNPVGAPGRINIDATGSSARRDAQVRHAITQLLRYTRRHGVAAIAVEDLNFVDARTTGRETMGRGARVKRFRKTVSGIPTAVSATGSPPWPRPPRWSYWQSTRLTAVSGVPSIGSTPTSTSPDTRPRPR